MGGKRGVLLRLAFLANKLVSQVTFIQEKGLLRAQLQQFGEYEVKSMRVDRSWLHRENFKGTEERVPVDQSLTKSFALVSLLFYLTLLFVALLTVTH